MYRSAALVAFRVEESAAFRNCMSLAILLAGVCVGLDTDPQMSLRYHAIFTLINDYMIKYIFLGEVVLKIVAEDLRPWQYFRDKWNLFDFIVTVLLFLPTGNKSAIFTFRLLR